MDDILQPDISQARAFLQALAPSGLMTFQTFPEHAKAKRVVRPRILHGDLDRNGAILANLNQQGCGIFVMVNEGNGRGRKAVDVVRVRAYVLDLDGAPIEPVQNCPEPPHIVVKSSPGKWHAYWLAADCPLDQFKPRQQALAARFAGDPAVCDLPRVMRLPGFWHLKAEPFMTRLAKPSLAHSGVQS